MMSVAQVRDPGSAAEALRISAVSKSFGAAKVLTGVDLVVGAGELVGLIGPNGSGKTTLFGIISGQVRPSAGSVGLFGRDVTDASAASRARAGIGRCFQIPQAFGTMTLYENLLVAARFGAGLGAGQARRLALEILTRTGFAGREDVAAETLPLLDRKRLELARALATDPKLLLLDEIAGGLTDEEAFALADMVADIRRSGVTVIWVEHLMHVLIRAVDRLVVLGEGRLVADGPPSETIADAAVRRLYLGLDGAADA